MDKPRLRYAEVFKPTPLLDLDSLVYEKSELLLDGKPVIYAGHHYDSLVWLKRKGNIEKHYEAEVMPRLRLAPSND